MDSIGKTRFSDIRCWQDDGLHEFPGVPFVAAHIGELVRGRASKQGPRTRNCP